MPKVERRCEHLREGEQGETCCDCGLVGCPRCVVATASIPQEKHEEALRTGSLDMEGIVVHMRCRDCAGASAEALDGDARGAAARHDPLVRKAWAILERYLVSSPGPQRKPGVFGRFRLGRAARLFRQALAIDPGNFATKFAMGKTYEALGDTANSLHWFEQAYQSEPRHADICREAGIAALRLGDFGKARKYCGKAVELRPDDSGLHANLALAELFLGRDAQAAAAIGTALEGDPHDPLNQAIKRLVDGVAQGAMPRPKSMDQLTQKQPPEATPG